MKKIIITTFLFVSAFAAGGQSISWNINSGTLTISGNANMPDYYIGFPAPWWSEASSIEHIKIENGIKNIGRAAFSSCTNLVSVDIPETVSVIGEGAFESCTKLFSIEIPGSVTEIKPAAFLFCSNLRSVSLPNSVQTLGMEAFYGCTLLGNVVLSDAITEIAVRTFTNCVNLVSVKLPEMLTKIDTVAFYDCRNLNTIEIPKTVETIGDWSFWKSGLQSINIPDGVIDIGNGAFAESKSLASVNIPISVKNIGEAAFYNCTSLKNVTVYWTNLDDVYCSPDFAFYLIHSNSALHVPLGMASMYEDSIWGMYFNAVRDDVLGFTALRDDNISVYVKDRVIVVENPLETMISLYDVQGRLHIASSGKTVQFPVSSYGIYVLKTPDAAIKILVE